MSILSNCKFFEFWMFWIMDQDQDSPKSLDPDSGNLDSKKCRLLTCNPGRLTKWGEGERWGGGSDIPSKDISIAQLYSSLASSEKRKKEGKKEWSFIFSTQHIHNIICFKFSYIRDNRWIMNDNNISNEGRYSSHFSRSELGNKGAGLRGTARIGREALLLFPTQDTSSSVSGGNGRGEGGGISLRRYFHC